MTPRTKTMAKRWSAGGFLALAALVGGWNAIRRPALDAAGIARTETVDAVRADVDTLRAQAARDRAEVRLRQQRTDEKLDRILCFLDPQKRGTPECLR